VPGGYKTLCGGWVEQVVAKTLKTDQNSTDKFPGSGDDGQDLSAAGAQVREIRTENSAGSLEAMRELR
jgi:hypothetical protein